MNSIPVFLRTAVAIWFIVGASIVLAEWTANDAPYHYYSSNSLVPRPWFPQFESWYPHNAEKLIDISTGICNLTLPDYRTAFAAPRDSLDATKLLSICYRHEACIVDQLQSNHLLNYQSALVIMGMLSALLSCIGSSEAEISALYDHRPLLSLLLSLGAPTLWTVSSLFEGNTPDRARATRMDSLAPGPLGPRPAAAVSACEYLVAAGAVANTLYTAVEVGRNTVLAWGCTTQFTPLFWALSPMIVHAIAAENYRFLVKWRITGVTGRPSGSKNDTSTGSLWRAFFHCDPPLVPRRDDHMRKSQRHSRGERGQQNPCDGAPVRHWHRHHGIRPFPLRYRCVFVPEVRDGA
ncbi:MAG: hypothetical protein LQ350_008244 [Teloschistes chrysophthalmus]|nr:MAG: hypothetical protein LQ350_008244 [Niorma chrysophthalma]